MLKTFCLSLQDALSAVTCVTK